MSPSKYEIKGTIVPLGAGLRTSGYVVIQDGHYKEFFETLAEAQQAAKTYEENESNNKIFKELVTQLIDLRLKLRSEKNYEMSDMIRDILESSNIQIEDSTDKIEWKIKD